MNRRLADDRPAAGLAGVGATGDVSGVTNARVSGDPPGQEMTASGKELARQLHGLLQKSGSFKVFIAAP